MIVRADASGFPGLARQRIRFDNSAPIVDLNGADPGTSNAIAYAEGESLTPIAPAATVTDTDSPDFDGGTLTVQFISGGAAAIRSATSPANRGYRIRAAA